MLAIVIPFYKLDFFKSTLASLAGQTNKDFKVYIGDDASPENPLPLIEEFQKFLEIAYIKFNENLGGKSLVEHWDRTISLIGDEQWLMILGDDDYLGSQVVERFYLQLPVFQEKSNLIRYATVSVDESSKPISGKYEHPVWETAPDSYFRRFTQQTRSSLSEYIFSKTSYEKFGFYDFPLAWYSDNQAWLDFADNKKIFSINSSVVYIRTSSINISGRTDNEKLKEEAQLEFFEQLVTKRLRLFKKEERIRLMRYYEDRLRENNRFTLKKILQLGIVYSMNYKAHDFKKFLKRIILHLFKN